MNKNAVWPGWKTVRLIRKEKTGSLYEIQREVSERTERAALKVITISCEPNEIELMHQNGYDDNRIANIYRERWKEVASVCLDNRNINCYDNIVSYDDVRYMQHEDGIGWDVLVKTELLTPLSDVLKNDFSDDIIIGIAKDICIALEVCEKHGLVHGNIDVSNIQVTDNGDCKLGDIGVERVFAKGEKIECSAFAAPESANNGHYNSNSDVFSLGLIMYWLLNDLKMPIFPATISNGIDDIGYRVASGDGMSLDFPMPKHGSEKLRKIVLKACSCDCDKRYRSAREMWNDLAALSCYSQNRILVPRIVKKKSKKLLWIIAAAALSAIVTVGAFSNFDLWSLSPFEHEHVYSYKNSDDLKHWSECECGEITDCVYHTYKWNGDSDHHWKECACGQTDSYGSHKYGPWMLVTAATETAPGLQKSVCASCDHYKTSTIPMLAHTHSYSNDWYQDETRHWKECACGNKIYNESHKITTWETLVYPTETTEGTRAGRCSVCEYYTTETIPKLSHTHSFSAVWVSDANSHWHQCTCGEKQEVASHSYNAWIVTKPATTSATGVQERACKVCGYTQTAVIPIITHTHSYTSLWISDANSHWHQCTCGEKSSVSSHTYGVWTTIKAATSTTTGQRQRTCTVCGYKQTETIPITTHSHNYSGGWYTNTIYHWKQCGCGAQANKAQHTYGAWTVIKEATTVSAGSKQRKCTVCGYTQTETIPILLDIDSISIKSKPAKTEYVVGDSLNTAGLAITVKYKNGSTETLTSGFVCTPTSFDYVGEKIVTVTYRDKKATFSVTVAIGYVQKISVNTLPKKTVYEIGEKLIQTGLKLTVYYTNGQTQVISNGFTCTPTSFASSGTKTVTVTYQGKSTSFTVTVNEATIVSVSIKTKPNKTTYAVGDTLNSSGLVLEVKYSDGSTKLITSGYTCTPKRFSSSGEKRITVTYQGFTTGFTVIVT